jgi:hypothetical protein
MNFKHWLLLSEVKKNKAPSFKWELENYHKDKQEEDYEKSHWVDAFNKKPFSHEIENVYNNYKNSLERKRPDTSLEFDRFYDYISRDDIKSFKVGNSYVFGSYINGILFPSHFSPESLKEGMKIIEQLQKYRAVLFVPEDLSKQAEKLGFIKIASNMPANFRDQLIFKNLLVSNRSLIPELKKMQEKFSLQ